MVRCSRHPSMPSVVLLSQARSVKVSTMTGGSRRGRCTVAAASAAGAHAAARPTEASTHTSAHTGTARRARAVARRRVRTGDDEVCAPLTTRRSCSPVAVATRHPPQETEIHTLAVRCTRNTLAVAPLSAGHGPRTDPHHTDTPRGVSPREGPCRPCPLGCRRLSRRLSRLRTFPRLCRDLRRPEHGLHTHPGSGPAWQLLFTPRLAGRSV